MALSPGPVCSPLELPALWPYCLTTILILARHCVTETSHVSWTGIRVSSFLVLHFFHSIKLCKTVVSIHSYYKESDSIITVQNGRLLRAQLGAVSNYTRATAVNWDCLGQTGIHGHLYGQATQMTVLLLSARPLLEQPCLTYTLLT